MAVFALGGLVSSNQAMGQGGSRSETGSPPSPSTPIPAEAPAAKPLQAVVIDVKGAAQWRVSETDGWKGARIDDLLDPGAQIRTGRGSSVALRVGKNATMLVASLTSVALPEIVEDGQVLRTRAALRRGKADFKVDEVGLSNDFQVLTPTSVTGVRGTGFGVGWGAFDGTQITSLHGNLVRAIEVRYFLTRLRVYLDQRSRSVDATPDPALAALFDTIGPPPMFGTLPSAQMLEQLADSGFAPDPTVVAETSLQQAPNPSGADFTTAFATPQEIEQFIADQHGAEQDLLVAITFCDSVTAFFEQLESILQKELSGQFDPAAFAQLQSVIEAFCDDVDHSGPFPFQFILDQLEHFCSGLGAGQTDTQTCDEVIQQLLLQSGH